MQKDKKTNIQTTIINKQDAVITYFKYSKVSLCCCAPVLI